MLRVTSSAIMGAGFQGVSEMLYLKKRILAIPMLAQYEQECNAKALQDLGVTVVPSIADGFTEMVRDWVDHAKPVDINFPNHTEKLIRKAINIKSPNE